MISDKEIQKRRLYKIKTYDGKVKEVAAFALKMDGEGVLHITQENKY